MDFSLSTPRSSEPFKEGNMKKRNKLLTAVGSLGVDLNGNSIARRYGHSAVLVGKRTFDDDKPITESNAKQNMYIFGGLLVDGL